VRDGLRDCLMSFLKNPIFKEIDWISEGRKDKLCREFSPLCEIIGIKNKLKYLFFRYIL